MNSVQELMAECTEAHHQGDVAREATARGLLLVTWLQEACGISENNARATLKIYVKLRDIDKRDKVIERLTGILQGNGKTVHEDSVKDLADCYMSRKKWSAKRLRGLYEGKGLYRCLLALRGLELGYGDPRHSLLSVFKQMTEAGHQRRQGSFVGITGQVQQQVHIEWWRAQ